MFIKSLSYYITNVIFLKDKIDRLYLHLIIQKFATSLISIFVPIFLLKSGFDLSSVFLFLLIQWSTFSLFTPIIGKIIEKIGLKQVIIIRTVLFIASLVSLSLIDKVDLINNNYLGIAFLLGFSSCIYILSVSSLYAKFMHKKQKGSETARRISLPKLGSIFGPIVGGFISMYFGFISLFIITSILLMVSIIPISFIGYNLNHPKFDLKLFFNKFKEFPKIFSFLNLYGVSASTLGTILPISLYLIGSNLGTLGIIISGITMVYILFSLWIGKKIDKINPKIILKIGAILTAICLAILGILSSSNILIYLSLITGLAWIPINIPFETKLYEQAKETENPLIFLAFKEFSFVFGRAILFSIPIFLGAAGVELTYYLGAFFSFLFLFF